MQEQALPKTRSGLTGAVPTTAGTSHFRVWAPYAQSLAVEISGTAHPLTRSEDGWFEGDAPARAEDDYVYLLDDRDRWPDPCSRWQPQGLRGPSRILDLQTVTHPASSWPGITLDELMIYELHIGTFSAQGTFDAAIPFLKSLRDLGVTAIEVMPINTFAGEHGWGYDGVYAYAPHEAYGGPAGFRRLVDAAHTAGLGVILDVVYNHLGAGSDAIKAFGPYLTDRHETGWGEALDYAQPAVREWAIQNAEMWVRDYGIDGLRLDAVHAIIDDSDPHLLLELADRVWSINPAALLIDEMEIGDLRPIDVWGHDAQWGDALHHAVHVLLTGEHDGYYAQYGSVADVARELPRPERRRFVVCAQNHDQVGNRALGDRLRGRDLRLAAFCSILSAGTPMLFQGEEYDETRPFQYFTDHIDPEIAEKTRDGRRREFSEFSDFDASDIPDPQDPETFRRSKLDRSQGDPEHHTYYQELLRLRRELGDLPVTDVEVDEDRQLLRWHRGDVTLAANFSQTEHDGLAPRTGTVLR